MNLPPLPPITDEDRELLHYNPNTRDIVAWIESYAEQYGRLCAEAERERLMDGFIAAMQDDLESGVKWLNEHAAMKFRTEYRSINEWAQRENNP